MVAGKQTLVVGVDIGGTFTDLVAVAGGKFWIAKVPSTPDDPSRAVAEGLTQLCGSVGISISNIAILLHGTTVATNALLQRRGAVTGLLTTKGFRDVLEIARQARPRLFDLDATRPQPLVPRSRRIDVNERMGANGRSIAELDAENLREAIEVLKRQGVEAVAVCFLHSYANARHEEDAARVIAQLWPEAMVSLSSNIIPEYREYERTSTTVANAFVAPVMSGYLSAMEKRLGALGMEAPLRVMQSSGGLMTVKQAIERAAATLLSGVAAGAIGGIGIGRAAGRTAAISIDIGGTSCDLALGVDGRIRTHRQYEVAGLPIRLPSLDVHTIGAGGGSIAYLDTGGGLCVGPRSAGASPGPACYGRGGLEPTVTDANLVLGRIPENLLDGGLALSLEEARASLKDLSRAIGRSIEATAAGIVKIINASMIRQMRVITIERGIDPRECALIAFGGGGPVHAADLAREMGITDVVIPVAPGVTSAMGLIIAGYRQDAVRTVLVDIGRTDAARSAAVPRLEREFSALAQELAGEITNATGQSPSIAREVEIRYRRQGHELSVPVSPGTFDMVALLRLEEDFHNAHEKRFGFAARGEPVLVVNVMVTSTLPGQGVPSRSADASAPRHMESRKVWFDNVWHETSIFDRRSLEVERRYSGPMIIEQLDTTTVVPPWAEVETDALGNLNLTLQQQQI